MKQMSGKKKMKDRESLISLAIFLLGLCILISSLTYAPGVRMFPALTGTCFMAIGMGNGISWVRAQKEEEKTAGLMSMQEALLFLDMLLTACLIKTLGFYVSLYLGMLGVCMLVMRRSSVRRGLVSNGFFCFLVVSVLFAVFHLILHIPTPSGLFV